MIAKKRIEIRKRGRRRFTQKNADEQEQLGKIKTGDFDRRGRRGREGDLRRKAQMMQSNWRENRKAIRRF